MSEFPRPEDGEMARDVEYYFPSAFFYENKPTLPPELRPVYHVRVSSDAELRHAQAIQPDYVDAEYTVGPALRPDQS